MDAAVLELAAAKEAAGVYRVSGQVAELSLGEPAYMKTGPYGAVLERTVVASEAFGPDLPKMRILMIHDCHYLPVEAANPHLVLARVEGYDTAVYGLPKRDPSDPLRASARGYSGGDDEAQPVRHRPLCARPRRGPRVEDDPGLAAAGRNRFRP